MSYSIGGNVFGVYLRFLAIPQFAIKNGFFVFKARAGKIFHLFSTYLLYISYIRYIFTS